MDLRSARKARGQVFILGVSRFILPSKPVAGVISSLFSERKAAPDICRDPGCLAARPAVQ